jgi:hypothetical protein
LILRDQTIDRCVGQRRTETENCYTFGSTLAEEQSRLGQRSESTHSRRTTFPLALWPGHSIETQFNLLSVILAHLLDDSSIKEVDVVQLLMKCSHNRKSSQHESVVNRHQTSFIEVAQVILQTITAAAYLDLTTPDLGYDCVSLQDLVYCY